MQIKIKAQRQAKNLTQAQLGKTLGVGASTVAMWEMGEAMPRAGKLAALAEALDCTIDELFEDSGGR